MDADKRTCKFIDKTPKVTDMLEMNDDLSKKLVEYFEKNFDVDFEELKQKYK